MLGWPGKVISSWSLQHSHASSSWLGTTDEAQRGAGRCLPGLRHNIHIHYSVVKGDDALQRLVVFMHLVGLCFPPLQMVCLACKYFKLPVN